LPATRSRSRSSAAARYEQVDLASYSRVVPQDGTLDPVLARMPLPLPLLRDKLGCRAGAFPQPGKHRAGIVQAGTLGPVDALRFVDDNFLARLEAVLPG